MCYTVTNSRRKVAFLTYLQPAMNSIERLEKFLTEKEVDPTTFPLPTDSLVDSFDHIGIQTGTFSYAEIPVLTQPINTPENGDSVFKLKDITVKFPVGKLSLVVGPTAGGKTSLLLAMLGGK